MTEEAKTERTKIKKHRSPNYPYVGLRGAIEQTRKVETIGGIHAVPIKSIMEAWKLSYGTTSSVIAALKSYGLVIVSGEGEQRQVQPSDVARKILADNSEKQALLKTAALSPPLYKELWEKYEGNLPPSDNVIKEYMVSSRGFNKAAVDAVIRDFRATISFADLTESEKLNSETKDDSASENYDDRQGANAEQSPLNENKVNAVRGQFESPKIAEGVMYTINIEVLNNGQINVNSAGALNSKTFKLLSDIYNLKERNEDSNL